MLIAVADLAAAGADFARRYGLGSIEGGRHPGWGTGNRIVPLGDDYLELVAVVDPPAAERATFGRWVARSGPGRPMGWAVRTADLDRVARRLGLRTAAGSRTTPDGRTLAWRTAGFERAAEDPGLPFFIEWAPGTEPPGRAPVKHRAGPVRLARLELAGDPRRLDEWLDGARLPVEVRPGPSGVMRVTLTSDAGRIVLQAAPSGRSRA